jgi:hypothetical protein
LTGIGGQASAALSPTTLAFTQAVNTIGTSTVTLNNSGALPLQVSTIQTAGATFSETNNCGSSVPAGQSCEIDVSFAPTSIGSSTGTLTVTDSASGSPHIVSLTGAGVAANIGLSYVPNNIMSATTPAGSGVITLIQVGGQGLSGNVSFSCSGLPQGASCSFSPATITAKPNAQSQVQVSISTTARSFLYVPIGVIIGLLFLATLTAPKFFKGTSMRLTPRLRWHLVPLFAFAICACGGGGGNSPAGGSSSSAGTPAGNSTVVITATSGSTTQTLNFTLVVK